MLETVLKYISDAYSLLEQLNLSVAGVAVLALGLTLALMFAVRELAAWFFKVDDIKRDIRSLRELNTQLEGEIRALQTLVSNLIAQESQTGSEVRSTSQITSQITSQRPEPSSESPSFPIVH